MRARSSRATERSFSKQFKKRLGRVIAARSSVMTTTAN
jgi:hypothetical protein